MGFKGCLGFIFVLDWYFSNLIDFWWAFFLQVRMIYIRKATLCKKSTEQTRNYKKRKKKTKKIHNRKPNNKLITKIKRAKKRRERITSHESPIPRPVKKSSIKRGKHLIIITIQILKSSSILFLPKTP